MANRILNQLGKQAIKLAAKLTLKLDVQFQTPLPPGAKIIAPNHPTTMDPFIISTITNEPVYIVVTESAFKVPLVGRYLRAAGHIPVVTGSGREAFAAAKQLLREGKTIALFPEGALSPLTGGLCYLHTGVARLALETGAPIIPVGIALETDHIRFMGAGVTDANGEEEIARLYSGDYAITVGQPLALTGNVEDRDYVKRVTDYLGQHISRLMRRSAYRLQPASVPVTQQTAEFPSL